MTTCLGRTVTSMTGRRESRERRSSPPLSPEVDARIKKFVDAAPQLTAEQTAVIGRLFERSRQHQRELADRGACGWNDCGKPMVGWAIEQVDGAVPVCQDCVARYDLTLLDTPC